MIFVGFLIGILPINVVLQLFVSRQFHQLHVGVVTHELSLLWFVQPEKFEIDWSFDEKGDLYFRDKRRCTSTTSEGISCGILMLLSFTL
jgi:hypothetical protein